MIVLLFFEGQRLLAKSGIGRALKHQMEALQLERIQFTTNPKDDFDILHINTIGPRSISLIRHCRRTGKKVVYHAHSTEEDFRNSFLFSNQLAPLFKKWLVYLYTKADCIITPTPYSKRLLENYGITLPIYAISNGIDLQRFDYDEDKVQAFRSYFSLCPLEKVVISVGLFFERKGILDFIEVAKRLPQYTFIWFGHVPLYSIPRNIRHIVTKDHPQNVIFPGYISGEILEGAYCGADAFFFPSYEETEGIVVLEALASYQQLILRDIPVYQPWMQDGVNCYMGHSVDEFEHLVEEVVEHNLPNIRKASRQSVETKSISSIGKQLREVYESLL